MEAGTLATTGIRALEELLANTPPPGVDAADVATFFARYRSALEGQLRVLLEQLLEPIAQRLDREWRGRWHLLDRDTVWTKLSKAQQQQDEVLDWLLSRVPIHRPDLAGTVGDWGRANRVALPPPMAVAQPVPRDDAGSLMVLDVPLGEAERVNALDKTEFARYAELAYGNDDVPGGVLLDIAVGYFGRLLDSGPLGQPAGPVRFAELRNSIAARQPALSATELDKQAAVGMAARQRLLQAAGVAAPDVQPPPPVEKPIPPVSKENAPTPEELLAALMTFSDNRKAAERTEANLGAIEVIDHPSPDQKQNWLRLMGYTGWGGLSIDAIRAKLPETWTPEDRSLVHEYYTPTVVALAIARVLLPWVPALPRTDDGFVMAIEPAAGIGRLLNAASTPGFEQLAWTAIEYSHVSASLLQAIRPDLNVANTSFEEWIQKYEPVVREKVGLVLSNPPYGQRGSTYTVDRNREYRESRAYVYFLRRGLDLLAAGGIGVFLIPYGFLTGISAAFVKLRESVLKRHHLRAAFRLPSNLFPGALLVVDLLFFESRGGELAASLPEDIYIIEGKYFERHPQHILGTEVGTKTDEDEVTAKPRWGYQVEGTFEGLPDFEPRLRCISCQVLATPLPKLRTAAVRARQEFEELPSHVQSALLLGVRVKRYLDLYTSGEHVSLGRASALQPELLEALRAWSYNLGQPRNSWEDHGIQLASKTHPELVAFLSAFESSGSVIAQISTKPSWQPRYVGAADDVVAQAAWLYSLQRELTIESLTSFREQLGIKTLEPLPPTLAGAGWCFDDGKWMPARDYYSGLLWDRYGRARRDTQAGDTQAAAQLARLTELIRFTRIDDIDPEPRMPWVPLGILKEWLEAWTGRAIGDLVWRDNLLQLSEFSYAALAKTVTTRLLTALGYINHDLSYFQPGYTLQTDPSTGEQESADQARDRARIEYGIRAKKHFGEFVHNSPDRVTQIEEAYNRLFRGYVAPEYSSEEIPIARWTGRIRLKPHQNAGARRLIANNGGLLGFDVGVGKTYTGIATIARLKEEGRARRPIVIVPNTIIWKWHKDFRAAVPDFRVLVVGSNRYLGRNGVFASKIDTPEERSLKWRQFQAGEYDVALVTYSVFGRTQVRSESLRDWVYETPVLLRKLGLDARELAAKIASGDSAPKKTRVSPKALEKLLGPERYAQMSERERAQEGARFAEEKAKEKQAEIDRLVAIASAYSDLTERDRAVFGEALDRWIAERVETYHAPDPDISFEDLGCDVLMVDEAQNFKNLWPVAAREGGVPKYLGAIAEGSDRAWGFAVRSHLVRKRNGGSGVFLLSATPAKNSPLEYFTLLGYVDSAAWSRLGISDPEIFIDRYLRLEQREIVSPDLSLVKRSVVAGFKNLDELRNIVFRFAEFRTAAEVGLVLPKSVVQQIFVDMDERQEKKYATYARLYKEALQRSKDNPKMRMKALGLLQRMAMTAIHSELDEGPKSARQDEPADDDEDSIGLAESRSGWTWVSASQVTNPHCPKLDRVVGLIMEKPDCGHLVFVDNIAVHKWLKMLLVEAGFPEARIAIFNANQAPDPAKRQTIAERFNGTAAIGGEDGLVEQAAIPPDFDVVIANATAYEGIDLHVRTCNVYHLDLPWEPATIQQRNGRAVRQGNMEAVIAIYYLLSERSLDAIRLNMITGKLQWMRDILASADRETSNPAAQSELSGNEMVLLMARSPEEAREAIEEQKRLIEEEQRKRVRDQAWNSLRGLVTRTKVLDRISDPADRQAVQGEIEGQAERLLQIPPANWEWQFLVPLAKQGQLDILLGDNWALLANSYVAGDSGSGFETGQIDGGTIGIRRFGTPLWESADREQPPAALLTLLSAETVEQGAHRWDRTVDEQRLEEPLAAAIEAIADGEFERLRLPVASRAWRKTLSSPHWWSRILAAIAKAGRGFGVLLPVKEGADSLALQSPDVAPKDLVMALDGDQWPDFLRRASASKERWTDLNATSLAWWGRAFPKGVLRRVELAEITILGTGGPYKTRPLFVEGSLAVTYSAARGPDSEAGARYTLTHIPSGKAILMGFRDEQVAVAALRYAAVQSIDWTQPEPDFSGAEKGFSYALRWMQQQTSAPSLAEIRRHSG